MGYEHGKEHEKVAGRVPSQAFKLGPVLWDGCKGLPAGLVWIIQ